MPRGGPASVSQSTLSETARALSEIAEQLQRVSSALAASVEGESTEAEALGASQEALADVARRLENWQAQEHTSADLREKLLNVLARGGPALPIELAAATLSLPEEIRPVLVAMEKEGLVNIREVKGGQLVTLTARGRSATRR